MNVRRKLGMAATWGPLWICLALAPAGAHAGRPDPAGAEAAKARVPAPPQLTPITFRVDDPPVPVRGSDGRHHVIYELELTNFTAERIAFDRLEVLEARGGAVLAALDAAQIAQRLLVRDKAHVPRTLGAAQTGLLYLHLVFDAEDAIPRALVHTLSFVFNGAPMRERAEDVRLAAATTLLLDAPLRGLRFIAGDGCCDSTRHVRATLPVNGRAFTAQRYAIDWEQLDEQGRIYAGDPKNPESYTIYGKPVYAVANARVVVAVDGLPNSPPGNLPAGMGIEHADGNHVILELGDGSYALFAHLKPGSVQVAAGTRVRRGQLLGHVGTSGNSSEPHLHFQVMDAPSALVANGRPYLLRSFVSRSRGVSTEAFDRAITSGLPIEVEAVSGAPLRQRALPLDLWIVDLPD